MTTAITRQQALDLLQKYNQEEFHLLHASTVEGVMRDYAETLGYGDEVDFWGLCGLLHDVDFEQYPDQHCVKAPELLAEAGKTVLQESHPRSSWRSSAEFRLALLEELTVQALEQAIALAKEG